MRRDADKVLDEYLVVMSRSGSREALAALVRRWSPRLFRYCARVLRSAELAQDVVQETWSSALRGLPRLSDPAAFPGWIYGIATRRCADLVRARVRDRKLEDELSRQADLNGQAVAAPAEALDLAAAIARLPMDQRLTIALHYGEDLGVEDVAAALGIPVGTVKSRLHTARKTLKLMLEGDSQ
jgi:RNA polymerase sigma-70 factor (ECF subfamily)